jgi:LuxR family maltose regulon positive regulatory protein
LEAAEAILRQCEMPVDKPRPAPSFMASPGNEFFYLSLCRYWVAVGSFTQAGFWLRHLLKNAERGQRIISVCQFNGLLSIMLAKQGQTEAAARLVRDNVLTATQSHLTRSIIDIGTQYLKLLDDYYRLRTAKELRDSSDPAIEHLHELLGISRGSGVAVKPSRTSSMAKPPRGANNKEVDSLTPRELQVLEQVAKGLKNREVAEELLIAESSVQWHIKNLYAKLDVHNRTEASVKARELNLIR